MEDNPADSRSRRRRQAFGDHIKLGAGIDPFMQQLIQMQRIDSQKRLFLVDQTLFHHFHGNSYRCLSSALACPGLQHVKFAFLNGEFNILHIAVMVLKFFVDVNQLPVNIGHGFSQCRDGMRRADTGDHVLTLRVHQVLAVEHILAGGRIAGKRHTSSGRFAHIAEHHGLYVHGSTPVAGDVIQLPVANSRDCSKT